MKKLAVLYMLLLSVVSISAQNMLMKVKLTDGTEQTFTAKDVQGITFELEPVANEPTYVDLGLSSGTMWASWDYEATSAEESGSKHTWNRFDEDDIVFNNWTKYYTDKKWRMPTQEDFQELIDGCDWSLYPEEGTPTGYKVAKKGDSSTYIILPFGSYWSKTPESDNSAYCIVVSNDLPLVDTSMKVRQFVIRPVWADPAITATVTTGTVQAGFNSATIPVTVTSEDAIVVESYGVYYSTNADMTDKQTKLGTGTLSKDFPANVTIDGLTQGGVTYYYQAFAKLKDFSNPKESAIGHFVTGIKSLAVSATAANVTYNAANVILTITGNSTEEVTYTVSYALASAEGYPTPEEKKVTLTTTAGQNVTVSLTDLEAEKEYKYQVTAKYTTPDLVEATAVDGTFTTLPETVPGVPEAVDLGLSVKWANFNLGAEKPSDYGTYYGFGDPDGTNMSRDASYYATGKMFTGIRGDVNYDAAAKKLGGHWRLPTPKEVEELARCTFSQTTQDGVPGWTITASNGNSIFIPKAGSWGKASADDYSDKDRYAYIWTDSAQNNTNAFYYTIIPTPERGTLKRSTGISIRPVYDDGTGSSSQGGGSSSGGSEDQEQSSPSDPQVAARSTAETGLIPVVSAKVDMGTITWDNKTIYWSPWNVGVSDKTGQYGKYYAWGELAEKDTYTLDNYADEFKNIHYSSDVFDNYQLPESADVARQVWGEGWRMPSEYEFSLLKNACTVTWTTQNGINGYKFTSKTTGNTLFFPAGGLKSGTASNSLSSKGYYWSSSVYALPNQGSVEKEWAKDYEFSSSSEPGVYNYYRYAGMLIRPVHD